MSTTTQLPLLVSAFYENDVTRCPNHLDELLNFIASGLRGVINSTDWEIWAVVKTDPGAHTHITVTLT